MAIGANALAANTTGNGSVAVGFNALDAATTADNNTAVGNYALTSLTTAGSITAVGYNAGNNLTTAPSVVAIGAYAGDAITTGGYHTAVGAGALTAATTGTSNTAIGQDSLNAVTTGVNNTGLGQSSGYAVTGNYGVFVGARSGTNQTSGDQNTYVGEAAGYSMTTGSRNTILGRYSGNAGGLDIRTSNNYVVIADGDGNPRITNDASYTVVNGPKRASDQNYWAFANSSYYADNNAPAGTGNSTRINFSQAGTQIGAIYASGGTSISYNTSSDHRLKENVVDLTGATARLKQLNPKRFNFIANPSVTVDGFLAHEAQTVVPEAVTGSHNEVDDDGNPKYQGIDQAKLVPLLVATIQELEARIATLEAG